MMNLVGILFQVPVSAQSAAAAMIGESIGANKVKNAYLKFKVMSFLTVSFIIILQVVVFFNRKNMVEIFSNDLEVVKISLNCMPLMIVLFVIDGI